MTRLPFRLFVILLALGATGALGYRAFQTDLAIGSSLDAARRAEQNVSSARIALAGVDAAMRSLIAPGQRSRTWGETVERQLDHLRELLMALEGPAPLAGDHPLDGALDGVDRLAAGAARVRGYMGDNQALLASDVVFNDIRETIAGLDQQVGRAGSLERGRHAATLSSLRQEQGLLVGAIIAVWLFATILLLPTGRGASSTDSAAAAAHATFGDLDAREPAPSAKPSTKGQAPWATAAAAPDDAPETAAAQSSVPAATVAPFALASAASLCTDLARVTDSRDISALLERASDVLDASGLIVWVAGPSGTELFPVASHGYDARVFARIGAVQRDSANLTAAAYREGALRTSGALESSAAAMAAPLLGPAGAVGVLSAELKDKKDITPGASALVTILAAQLATLVGSMPPAATETTPPAQQANA
jgi:hypothetical protein